MASEIFDVTINVEAKLEPEPEPEPEPTEPTSGESSGAVRFGYYSLFLFCPGVIGVERNNY